MNCVVDLSGTGIMCVGVATGEQAPMECRLVSVPNPKVFAERRREDERAREHQSPTHPSIHPSAALSSLPSFFLPLSFLLYPLNEQSLFGCRQFAQMRRLSSMYLFAPCLPSSLQRREIGPEVRSSASDSTYQSIFLNQKI